MKNSSLTGDLAIRAEGLAKMFRIDRTQEYSSYATLGETIVGAAAAPFRAIRDSFRGRGKRGNKFEEFWALKGISFEVRRGEVVGIIGRNGAGKSTLLKILSRITEPTSGFADIRGRVGSLLEVGTGFHPELSGRENVFLNGAILGMRRVETERKFDEIVAFAEIEKFIDTPVKRYSSGMYMRLAFAVAAHLEPDILLVDEVLAVGDAAFQKKCLGKMQDVALQGRTVLFVSHNLATVNALCNRGILLHGGTLLKDGITADVLQTYGTLGQSNTDLDQRVDRDGNGAIRFRSVKFESKDHREIDQLSTGQEVRIVLGYSSRDGRAVTNVDVGVTFKGPLGELYFVCNAGISQESFPNLPPEGKLVCTLPRLPLPPGTYNITLWSQVGTSVADRVENAATVEIISGDFYGTGKLPAVKNRSVLVEYEWSLDGSGRTGQVSSLAGAGKSRR